ncbi:recombinase family protein [Saccharothrix syringae]|uniref:Recombinase family protein n=1 Tax=Saccharothrix syringae TaxID=103733 RepID=A0A5Q0GU01_SACSY|nr:recombinase family protein [Saccharothrix syringae]QFZ17566.1 recombinase family protein [Saccharothrix syringae]
MAVLGYARVSTTSQVLDRQIDALVAAGVPEDRIYTDKISGAKDDRPGLAALLDYVREGDTVVVHSLDRLGRSLSGLLRTVETFKERGVVLRSLKESIDTSTDVGVMLLGIFGTLAQYERALINERAADARAAAKARGKQTGRPRALAPDQVALARRMRAAGESVATICGTLKVSRATLYRVLGEDQAPAPA